MLAYKVLVDGRSAFSGTSWPLPSGDRPGEWVSASGTVQPYVTGVHASSVDQLPQWLGDQLYRIELDGQVTSTMAAIVALRGRLLAAVQEWDEPVQMRFSGDCAERARLLDRSTQSAQQWMDTIERLAGVGDTAPTTTRRSPRNAPIRRDGCGQSWAWPTEPNGAESSNPGRPPQNPGGQ